jgi:hypothetical protein
VQWIRYFKCNQWLRLCQGRGHRPRDRQSGHCRRNCHARCQFANVRFRQISQRERCCSLTSQFDSESKPVSDALEFEGILDALLLDMVNANVPPVPKIVADVLARIFHSNIPEPEYSERRQYLETFIWERIEVMRKEAAGQPRSVA